ncbi:MAG TPA: hypothetical protein VMM35_04005 [Longimicrobiales bacterium]|nr:hypothetical protein [Longimicrobiales bacterium]
MAVLALALAWLGCAAGRAPADALLAPGDHDITVTHADCERFYLVRVPPAAAKGAPLPVVLDFHGGGGTPEARRA